MTPPVIVFDFDKTLTKKDTIFGFYREVHGVGVRFKLKYFLFLGCAVLAKLNLVSNSSLKSLGVKLFLKGADIETLREAGKLYSEKIELNKIYEQDFKKYPKENVIVMSASFEEYLEPLFPGYTVVGSKISYSEDGKAEGLDRNLYGQNKPDLLANKGIKAVDILFTDSFSDKPLMDISNCVYLVNGEKKEKIKGENCDFENT